MKLNLNFFKQASRLANFKNVASSLASRHQRWLCYELSSRNFLQIKVECGPPVNGYIMHTISEENRDIKEGLMSLSPQISDENTVSRPTWVRQDGILYQMNNTVLITGSDGLDPFLMKFLLLVVT